MKSDRRSGGDDSLAVLCGAVGMALFTAAGLEKAFGAMPQTIALGLLAGGALAFFLFMLARERG